MSAHLRTVLLDHEKRMLGARAKSPGDAKDLYNKFLSLIEKKLRTSHRSGAGGWEVAEQRSEMTSEVLRHMFERSLESAKTAHPGVDPADSVALMAVGGFGRGELSPHSDIDILFLYDKQRKNSPKDRCIQDVIEQVLYVLWDVGLKVGHASRTLDEVAADANGDLKTKTAMLQARLISGPERIYQEFERRFDRLCIKGFEQEYLEWRIEDQETRHEKYGNTVFLQEPDIKNGCGGLRDYHNLQWVARVKKGFRTLEELKDDGWLNASELKSIEGAYDFLLRVRNSLHYLHSRPTDHLTLKAQGQIANVLKYPQRTILRRIECLMKDYYEKSRDLYLITNLLSRRLSGTHRSRTSKLWTFLPGRARSAEEVQGLTLDQGQIFCEKPDLFRRNRTMLVRTFRIMQQRNLMLSPEIQNVLTNQVKRVGHRMLWNQEVRELLEGILTHKGKVGRILRAMHDVGLLGKLIPEFEPITCLVQHEFYHRYTADEHTLQVVDQLDKMLDATKEPYKKYRALLLRCETPEVLYMALVLHDTGKSEAGRNHSDVSAELATKAARRMRWRGQRLKNLVFLVDHHLTMSEYAQRRNLDDPEVIRDFARIVQTPARLEMLMMLTFADAKGTDSRSTWSDWKDVLLWQLYLRTADMLEGEEEFLRRATEARRNMIQQVRSKVSKGIDDAEFFAHFHLVPDLYLQHAHEELMIKHVEQVHKFFISQMSSDAALKPIVHWEHKTYAGHSEVVVVSWNRASLFSRISGAFALAELNILSADIITREDDVVVDSFRVSTQNLEAVVEKRDQQYFDKMLAKTVEDPDFDVEKNIREIRRKAQMKLVDQDAFPTILTIDNDSSSTKTLLHVQTPDKIGVLYSLATALSAEGIQVSYALITTEKGAALNTFYIEDAKGGKVENEKRQRRVIDRLRSALQD